jgi:ankyrin repeat protein
MTPLHLSAQEGNTEVIKVLVEAGASLFAALEEFNI